MRYTDLLASTVRTAIAELSSPTSPIEHPVDREPATEPATERHGTGRNASD